MNAKILFFCLAATFYCVSGSPVSPVGPVPSVNLCPQGNGFINERGWECTCRDGYTKCQPNAQQLCPEGNNYIDNRGWRCTCESGYTKCKSDVMIIGPGGTSNQGNGPNLLCPRGASYKEKCNTCNCNPSNGVTSCTLALCL